MRGNGNDTGAKPFAEKHRTHRSYLHHPIHAGRGVGCPSKRAGEALSNRRCRQDPLCSLAVGLKYRLGLDDSLDVVGVHLVGGVVGTVGIGFLGTRSGLFYGGGGKQLVVQVIIAVAAIAFSGVLTLAIGLALKYTIGIRVSDDEEAEGLDTTIHGESAYDDEAARGPSLLGAASSGGTVSTPAQPSESTLAKEGAPV